MAVIYRKYQNKNSASSTVGNWYGRSLVLNEISTKDLAEEISHSTTVTYADVVAVLAETCEKMKDHLQNSDKVTLDGLGSFRVGLKTVGSETSEEFSANNITGYRILFRPEVTFTATGAGDNGGRTGFYTKTLLAGISAKEAPTYSVSE